VDERESLEKIDACCLRSSCPRACRSCWRAGIAGAIQNLLAFERRFASATKMRRFGANEHDYGCCRWSAGGCCAYEDVCFSDFLTSTLSTLVLNCICYTAACICAPTQGSWPNSRREEGLSKVAALYILGKFIGGGDDERLGEGFLPDSRLADPPSPSPRKLFV